MFPEQVAGMLAAGLSTYDSAVNAAVMPKSQYDLMRRARI